MYSSFYKVIIGSYICYSIFLITFQASMGSGSVSFCGMSMDWNDVLADYEGITCLYVCVCVCCMYRQRGIKQIILLRGVFV